MNSIHKVILGISTALTLLFSWIYFQRSTLSYNDEGRFFDDVEAIVYHQQDQELFGILALGFLMMTGIVLWMMKKSPKPPLKKRGAKNKQS